MKHGEEYKFNTQRIKEAKEIVFYGWDFSNCKMTDPAKFNDVEIIKTKYIPSWIGLLNKLYNKETLEKEKGQRFDPQIAQAKIEILNTEYALTKK